MKKMFLALLMISATLLFASCNNSSSMKFSSYGEEVTKEHFDYELDLVINGFEFYVDDAEFVGEVKYQEKIGKSTSNEYVNENLTFDIDNGTYKRTYKSELVQKSPYISRKQKTKRDYLYQGYDSSYSGVTIYRVNLNTKEKATMDNDSIKNIYEESIASRLSNSYKQYSNLLDKGDTVYYFNNKTQTLSLEAAYENELNSESFKYRYQIKYADDCFIIKIYYEENNNDNSKIQQCSMTFQHKKTIVKRVNLSNYNN